MGMREIQRGEIYLADLGEGVGSEQKGVRPVLIVQNNRGSHMSDHEGIKAEYRYFALKFQLIHPNPVMAYMMLISTGKKLDKARSIVIKKFCEPYCWENRHR